MSTPQIKIMTILFALIITVSCAVPKVWKPEEMSKVTKVHNCDMCHLPHQKDMQGKPLLSKPLTELCVSCHQARIGKGEHKIGIKPPMPVEELPLNAEGEMTCVTCHDPHGIKGFGMLLRAPNFNDICKKCHKDY